MKSKNKELNSKSDDKSTQRSSKLDKVADKKQNTRPKTKNPNNKKTTKENHDAKGFLNSNNVKQTIILSLVVILAIIASQIYNKTADNATEKETNTETERNVKDKENETKPSSIYDFSVKDILGNTIDLNIYRGYVILIVNVASECGFTDSNYRDLSALKKVKVNGKPLRILAFPCNQFGGQEPGSNKDIMNFARSRNAPFDYFEKIDVYGVNAHPLFKYLQEELGSIYWNFYKFIINENGIPVYKLASNTYYDDILSTLKELFENVDY